jgi:hypothetical protein
MKNTKLNILDVLSASLRGRQLHSLLQNIFERGTDGCEKDDELIGLAYDISGKLSVFLDQLEEEENK